MTYVKLSDKKPFIGQRICAIGYTDGEINGVSTTLEEGMGVYSGEDRMALPSDTYYCTLLIEWWCPAPSLDSAVVAGLPMEEQLRLQESALL